MKVPVRPACLLFLLAAPLLPAVEPHEHDHTSRFDVWWDGPGLSGRWLGARPWLEERGLKITGNYYGALFGVVDSARGSRGFWDQGLQFGGEVNLGKLAGQESLEGFKAFATFRWRDPSPDSNPNDFVEASSMFNPTNWQSGTQFRVLAFGGEISSGKLFASKDLFVLRGGWLQPQSEFLVQPLSKLFLNNPVNSAKGIGGNIPFSSSFSTWGGTLRIAPFDWFYIKAGLFMAYPEATSSSNHGLAFAGFAKDPSQNGLFSINEIGFQPKIGPSELPGRYAFGGYYWGNQANAFDGSPEYGQYGFYWQASQMVFREPVSRASAEARVTAGQGPSGKSVKSFKEPVSAQLDDQGLTLFGVATLAPEYNNTYPFYFHAGLAYRGLIPTRDDDQLLFVLAYANYSGDKLEASRAAGKPLATCSMFLEWGYRLQLNQWAFVQPFAQYAIRPAGTSNIPNATILGISVGAAF